MFSSGRNFHAVPERDPIDVYHRKFKNLLELLHLDFGIGRIRREADRYAKEAEKAGATEVAECLKTAFAALQDAREELKR